MFVLKVVMMAVLLLSTAAFAAGGSYRDAQSLYEAGEYARAEEVLKDLISTEPNNAKYRQLLGDAYRKEGRLDEAMDEFEKARKLAGDNVELLKSIGTTYKWNKEYSKAGEAYRRALVLDPKDREAREDLDDVRSKRRLRFTGSIGGWEPDYTTESYEARLSYSGFDRTDLNAGYGYADQIYYTRHKYYANAYYFYNQRSYVKPSFSYKDYDYPVDPAVQKPNPDSNSYDKVPSFEVEVSHWLTGSLRSTLAYEFFRPSFFHDQDAHANNHKISAEAYYITKLEYLRLKLMYAWLRDPDPDKTEIKGRDNLNTAQGTAASTQVEYHSQSLLGFGIELLKDRWEAELKYLPNRDLDSSYSYSYLLGAGYRFTDNFRGRLDYVYDKYSSKSSYSGQTANVYLASVFYRLNPSVEAGVGVKYIDLPTKDDTAGFLTISYRTGLGL